MIEHVRRAVPVVDRKALKNAWLASLFGTLKQIATCIRFTPTQLVRLQPPGCLFMRTSPPDDIDLATLGRAARRALPRIALVSLLAGGLTAGTMLTMAPRYTSKATIEIVARPTTNPVGGSSGQDVMGSIDPQAIGTHVRKLLSTDNTLRMMKELGLADKPEFNAALEPEDTFTSVLRMIGLGKPRASETDEDRVLSAYAKAMKVAQLRETRNIMIEFTTSDAAFSAKGANRLADIYRESLATSIRSETVEARDKLKIEMTRLEKEVSDIDNRVTQFRGQRDLFKGNIQQAASLKEQQLGELTAEYSKASAARTEAEARATAAKEQMKAGSAESNPDVQKSQIIPRLSEQRIRLERQVSELAASLLPAHPRMRQIQGDLASLQRQIKEEVKKVVDGMDRDAKISAEKESSLKKRIAEVKGTITTAAPDDAQLKGLEDTAKSKRAELERVQKAYEAALSSVQTGVAPVEARIVERAVPLNEKVFPKPGMFAPLVMLATLLVGLAWSVTTAIVMGPASSGGSRSEQKGSKSDRAMGLVPLATPLVAAASTVTGSARIAAPTVAQTTPVKPAAIEPNRDIAATVAALLDRDVDGACRTLIAGDSNGFDAAAEALAIAKDLSAAGKAVVLVDWSTGTTSLTDQAGGAAAPGLAQLIQGDVAFEDAIQKLADTEAHLVSAGNALDDPSVMFDADRANLVLDALDEAFEHIIVYANHDAARDLFEATQGRFDTGVVVADLATAAEGNVFLGFDVGEMVVHHILRAPEPTAPVASTLPRRSVGARHTRPAAEARA